MIKLLICDGDGTLELPRPSPATKRLVASINNRGIELAVASNAANRKLVTTRFHNAGLPPPKIIVTRSDLGVAKPSPRFVSEIVKQAGVELKETAFLGDSDDTDIFCALNAHVLPLAALYSPSKKGDLNYGLPVHSPKHLQDYLETFGGQQEPYFGWTCDHRCSDTGGSTAVFALLGQHGGHTDDLKTILKDRGDVLVGQHQNPLRSILFHYLVNQVFQCGLTYDVDYWTVYPGHLAASTNALLADFSDTLAKVFKDRPLADLLVRHKDAPESKRISGSRREIFDQFNTIQVNPQYAAKIDGKTIVVLDDFTTSGSSLETARRMLLRAGAKHVVGVSFAKYRVRHSRTQIGKGWDPFKPCTLTANDITVDHPAGTFRPEADSYFWGTILPIYSK